jgi:hypothetical protein
MTIVLIESFLVVFNAPMPPLNMVLRDLCLHMYAVRDSERRKLLPSLESFRDIPQDHGPASTLEDSYNLLSPFVENFKRCPGARTIGI